MATVFHSDGVGAKPAARLGGNITSTVHRLVEATVTAIGLDG
jgi:hypothetical protein